MNMEPTATVPGKRYRLWLQFEGGKPAADLKGAMSDRMISKRHAEMVEFLMSDQPAAVIEDRGLVLAILHLEPNDTTALLWVSEA